MYLKYSKKIKNIQPENRAKKGKILSSDFAEIIES